MLYYPTLALLQIIPLMSGELRKHRDYALHEASENDEVGCGEKRRGFAPRPHLRGLPTEVGEKSLPLEEWERIPAKTLVKRLPYSVV